MTHVNPEPIRLLDEHGFIPVIAPVGRRRAAGRRYNINADLVAGEVAAALQAEKLIHLTDVEGIKGPGGRPDLDPVAGGGARAWWPPGVIDGGMLPKVESSLRALEAGDAPRPTSWTAASRTRSCSRSSREEGIGTEIVL